MHYFKRNIGDYHKKAGRLSMLEHGAYTLLMDACYDREQFPTIEQAYDWCWARTDEEKAAVRFVLEKFFCLEDGRYTQNRIQEEIDRFHKNASINSKIAQDREEKRRTNRAQTVHEESTNRHLTINQEPRTINQEPVKKSMQRGTRLPADFELPDDWVFFCKQERPELVPREVFAGFKDYWISQAGVKATKTDWFATWRNWVRNQKVTRMAPALSVTQKNKQEHYSKMFGRSDDERTIEAITPRLG